MAATKQKRLSYPRNRVYEKHTDYITFEFYNYLAPFGSDTATGAKSTLNAYQNTAEGTQAKVDNTLPKILLYMPEDIQTATGAQWGEKSFTNTGRDAMKTAGSLLDGDPGKAVAELGKAIGNSTGRLPSFIAASMASAINALPGGIGGNVGLNDVLSGAKGIVLNPNVELLYQGYGLREFDHVFKFTPHNKDEAKEIQNIVNTFRKAALPNYGAEGIAAAKQEGTPDPNVKVDINDNYISVPNLVKVRYMKGNKDHPYLPKYLYCAITDINVNYTPDGTYATYEDGSPVATTLSVSFTETKLIYRSNIDQGY